MALSESKEGSTQWNTDPHQVCSGPKSKQLLNACGPYRLLKTREHSAFSGRIKVSQ